MNKKTEQELLLEAKTAAVTLTETAELILTARLNFLRTLSMSVQSLVPKHPVKVSLQNDKYSVLITGLLVETPAQVKQVERAAAKVMCAVNDELDLQLGAGHARKVAVATMSKADSIRFYADDVRRWEMDNSPGPNKKKLLKERGIG